MTNLAVATLEVRDSWDQLEDALSNWSDPHNELPMKAARWWMAREQLHDVLVEAA